MPYYPEKTHVTVHNDIVAVKAFQIIVWISVSRGDVPKWDVRSPQLPAILDTGSNHNFAKSSSARRPNGTGPFEDRDFARCIASV